jgi:Glu-tRNA(Gln) amidotransferase subunit E-like FAD-binding protein
VQTKTRSERQVDEVVRWRREQLAETGFSLPLAAQVANDARYDLHALIELVERGCPPELAARILAPLERELDAA